MQAVYPTGVSFAAVGNAPFHDEVGATDRCAASGKKTARSSHQPFAVCHADINLVLGVARSGGIDRCHKPQMRKLRRPDTPTLLREW
jgi:hypothetical protein